MERDKKLDSAATHPSPHSPNPSPPATNSKSPYAVDKEERRHVRQELDQETRLGTCCRGAVDCRRDLIANPNALLAAVGRVSVDHGVGEQAYQAQRKPDGVKTIQWGGTTNAHTSHTLSLHNVGQRTHALVAHHRVLNASSALAAENEKEGGGHYQRDRRRNQQRLLRVHRRRQRNV